MGSSGTFVLFFAFFALAARRTEGSSKPWLKSEKHAEMGTEVLLPCVLKLPQCGGLHSIKWYHGSTRILIFSEGGGLTRGNNDIAARSDMIYVANTTETNLKIPDLKLADEGLYKCEATYLAVNRECNNIQHITLIVTVAPTFIHVLEEDSKTILSSGTTLGPVNEGTKISLNCESGRGKPVPIVEWYKDDELLNATSSVKVDENGIGTGSSRLGIEVSRNELGATFVCKSTSPALTSPLVIKTILDVNVSPLKMGLGGVKGHVIKGTRIVLHCAVSAARPAAEVTWYNGTTLLGMDNERLEKFPTNLTKNPDGTYETKSYLAFTATEYDNGKTFTCQAENAVSVKPMKEAATIDVMYAPIVTLKPDNITVNETGEFFLFCDYEANPTTLTKIKWMRNDEELTLDEDRFEGGTTEQTALRVKNSTPDDMGNYTCVLQNSVGESTTDDFIAVSVLYKPVVAVTMEPETPVNEADHLNVSLSCEVIAGNPTTLNSVRWYLGGDLLKELPDCGRNATPATGEDVATFCDIDPSKLLLEAVGRTFHGNYSCEGRNDAGWGPISPSTPVTVYYKPGPASMSYEPRQVVKNGPLKINCSVVDPGRPEATGFKWMRGQHRLPDETEAVLTIESVNLETEANFTCMAYNDAGDGDPVTRFIDVSAPPTFIRKLPPYQGYAYNSPNISIECRVECAPICNISWMKENAPMDFSSTDRYYLSNVYLPPDPRTNDFESVQSTLFWNLTAWPGGQLDRFEDNGNFTCQSTKNDIGPGVKSDTQFKVEYPPENMTISPKVINVIADQVPESILCEAKAHPEPTFEWYREGNANIVQVGSLLTFKTPFPRRSSGNFYCRANNRRGNRTISAYINVQFKPECRITKERIDGQDYAVCSAEGNPEEADFAWSLKSDNDTLEQRAEERDGKSYLPLDDSVTNFRTYVCVANNSIGWSTPCEHGEPGNVRWWLKLEGDLLIIVIVVASVIVLAVIIVCIVIFLVCRRKRNKAKYNNRVVELEEREHPDGGPASPTVSSHSTLSPGHFTPAPRWPLKPGVLVHVNRTHSLRSGLSGHANDLQDRRRTSPVLAGRAAAADDRFHAEATIARAPVRALRAGRATSMTGMHDEGMLARANKIRTIFSAQLKDPDTLPGISREKTAVTYKRIAPRQRMLHNAAPPASRSTASANVSRKRKKPGADPNQAANNNHVDSVSEGLTEPETKTFYENLPFHGIQTPPNKLVSPKFARVSALHGTLHPTTNYSPSSSRPPSRAASLCGGSSGYGSTRSHLGPHYGVHNMPRSNSPEPKYNTLKPRRRKHKHAQFYSLRLCRRHRTTHRNYQLYAVPICKTCPHRSGGSGSTSTIATVGTVDSSSDARRADAAADTASTSTRTPCSTRASTPIATGVPTPPTPAPRTKKTDPSRHTYQNVPTPVYPRTSSALARVKTNDLYNYQEHYQQQHQQQQQQQQQELQQYGYPLPSSSSSQLTLPLTRSLHHSSAVSPLQPTYAHTNNRHSLSQRDGKTAPLSLVHGGVDLDLTQDHQPRRHTGAGGRRHERRKHRKHERNDRKQKPRRSDPSRRADAASCYAFSPRRETSFDRVQELGIPENYKISYPHYYEDEIVECPTDYPARTNQSSTDNSNRYSADGLHYADLSLTKPRGKAKRHSTSALRDNRPPSAPPATQYAELHFRDVGREIDV